MTRRAANVILLAACCALVFIPASSAARSIPPRPALSQALRVTSGPAAAALKIATNKSLWLSPREVVAPPYGTTVFGDCVAALTALERVSGGAAAATLIVHALHAVTSGAISQARGGNQRLIAAARRKLAAGAQRAGAGQFAAAARAYTTAWKTAFSALTRLIEAKVTSVPAAALSGAAAAALGSKTIGLAGPMIQPNLPPLTAAGKPELFFAGAEGCPFCAVERWGMIVALSQFGTFSNLHLMQSETTERPAVRTLTFFGAHYRSPYISFVPVEVVSNVRRGSTFVHLQRLTKSQRALVHRFDPPGQTPFIDVANRFTSFGSTAAPQLLGGMTWTQIAGSLTDPASIPAQTVGGEAEVMTAEICLATQGIPASVCSAALVQQYEAALPLLDGRGGGCPLAQAAAGARLRSQPPRAGEARCHT
jgi:hypothetical protein